MHCLNVGADWIRLRMVLIAAGVASVLAAIPIDGALAGLTYVDADSGENFSPNLSPLSAIAATAISNDNFWGRRNDVGAAAADGVIKSVFEASASGGVAVENAPQIVQTISELTPHTSYDVYVAYWQGPSPTSNWNVRAGFTSGNLTLFNAKGPNATFPSAVAGTNAYYFDWEMTGTPTNPDNVKPHLVNAGRTLLLGHVGARTSTAGGQINVFIDDLPTTIGGPNANPSDARTWFDGLAYAPAGTDVFIARGDFNDDNSIDPADAHIFLINLHTDVSDFTVLDSYRVGDLNADLVLDHRDFAAFKQEYTGEPDLGSAGNLTLQVFAGGPNAGAMQLRNSSSFAFDFDYYEVKSASGALNMAGWVSLADTEGDELETLGWDEVPASNAMLLSEINLQSSTTLGPAESLPLGQAFHAAGSRDLEFFYGLPDGSLVRGAVQYISDSLTGDYNRNGIVDAADYVVWRKSRNQNVPNGSGADGDGSGIVQQADYVLWRANFGRGLGASTSPMAGTVAPEPASTSLSLAALAILLLRANVWRRR